jgi:hypothetical protein
LISGSASKAVFTLVVIMLSSITAPALLAVPVPDAPVPALDAPLESEAPDASDESELPVEPELPDDVVPDVSVVLRDVSAMTVALGFDTPLFDESADRAPDAVVVSVPVVPAAEDVWSDPGAWRLQPAAKAINSVVTSSVLEVFVIPFILGVSFPWLERQAQTYSRICMRPDIFMWSRIKRKRPFRGLYRDVPVPEEPELEPVPELPEVPAPEVPAPELPDVPAPEVPEDDPMLDVSPLEPDEPEDPGDWRLQPVVNTAPNSMAAIATLEVLDNVFILDVPLHNKRAVNYRRKICMLSLNFMQIRFNVYRS